MTQHPIPPPHAAPPPRPRKERKDNADRRRRQLLDAAVRSIVSHGLSRTTLATVAAEAGLSQGVAGFYYGSKNGLLTHTLRDLYDRYQRHWTLALDKAGPDPLHQLVAMLEADFDPRICNPDLLSVWFAFWGEQKFTPQYAEICSDFDVVRSTALSTICTALLPAGTPEPSARGAEIADLMDTLTDGFWQKMHLYPDTLDAAGAVARTKGLLRDLYPHHAAALR